MSTIVTAAPTFRRSTLRLAVSALFVAGALVAGLGSAHAQSQGRGGDGDNGGNDRSAGSSVILFGSRDNCPPTIACGGDRQPPRRWENAESCTEFYRNGVLHRRCMIRR